MPPKPGADDRDSATDLDVYLPAGITPPVGASRLEQLWGYLFTHGVEPPN
jgi:hypothetical protein